MRRPSVTAGLLAAGVLLVVAVLAAALVAPGAPRTPDPSQAKGAAPRAPPDPPAPPATRAHAPAPPPSSPPPPRIRWRQSTPLGLPYAGRLVNGVALPAEGEHFFTWDPVRERSPNRPWRRVGTDGLVRITLRVVRGFALAHPNAPRVGIGDLSRPHGGDFGPQFGGVGHASHQNGLDVDVYYPRRDRRERAPKRASQVDRRLAQDLVDRFVAAGAERIFVGPNVGLTGPRKVVQVLGVHDDHLHVRLPRARA